MGCCWTEQIFTKQGRNVVRWRPGQEASLAPSCSNLNSFGSKCTVLKKVLVTLLGLFSVPRSHSAPTAVMQRPGNCAPLVTPLFRNVSNPQHLAHDYCHPPRSSQVGYLHCLHEHEMLMFVTSTEKIKLLQSRGWSPETPYTYYSVWLARNSHTLSMVAWSHYVWIASDPFNEWRSAWGVSGLIGLSAVFRLFGQQTYFSDAPLHILVLCSKYLSREVFVWRNGLMFNVFEITFLSLSPAALHRKLLANVISMDMVSHTLNH